MIVSICGRGSGSDKFVHVREFQFCSYVRARPNLVESSSGSHDLQMCTSKEGGSETMDLIDCRIKVWWPMDKKFYGVVKSYDPQKKKHVVLYDDGDMEVLCLDKERWELIDNGHKPTKKSKPSKGSPHKELNSPSKIRGKRTPRKNLKHVQKGASKSKTTSELLEADSRGSPGISDPKHAEMHKHDDMNSE